MKTEQHIWIATVVALVLTFASLRAGKFPRCYRDDLQQQRGCARFNLHFGHRSWNEQSLLHDDPDQ